MTIKAEKFFVDGKETKENGFFRYETADGRFLSCHYDWLEDSIGLAFEPLKEYSQQLVSLSLDEEMAAASIGCVVEALVKKAKMDLMKWETGLCNQIGRIGIKRIDSQRGLNANDPEPMQPVGGRVLQYEDANGVRS